MSGVHEILEKAKDFFAERKRKTLVVCLVLVFMTACAFIILAVQLQTKSSGRVGKKYQSEQALLNLDEPLFVPEGPAVPNEYIISHESGEKWSEDQIDEWFTFPGEAEISRLDSLNGRIVNDIIEAAP